MSKKNPNHGGRRDGAGRKRVLGDKPYHRGITLSAEQAKDIKKAALKFGITPSELLRRAAAFALTDKQHFVSIQADLKEKRHAQG